MQSIPYTDPADVANKLSSIASILQESENLIPIIRAEFRGETMAVYDDGHKEYIQVTKPIFTRVNLDTKKPIKKKIKYHEGNPVEVYEVNEEAVEEVISMLKFMGLNNISRLSNLSEDNVLDDLKEFEFKLAAVLALKQQAWGIEKAFLPMMMVKIKTIVQDARYMAVNGNTLKAIQKTITVTESHIKGMSSNKRGIDPYARR